MEIIQLKATHFWINGILVIRIVGVIPENADCAAAAIPIGVADKIKASKPEDSIFQNPLVVLSFPDAPECLMIVLDTLVEDDQLVLLARRVAPEDMDSLQAKLNQIGVLH